jgi:hypothetical protein
LQGVELVLLQLPKTDTILDPIIESLMKAFDPLERREAEAARPHERRTSGVR